MTKISGRDKRVADWLEKIGIDPKMTRRVIIDIPCDGAVWVYIEQFGDSRIFEVEPPPELTTAIRVEPPQDDFEEAIKIAKGLKLYPDDAIKVEDDPPIYKLEKNDKPTPEWLAEFEAKKVAIEKWERPDD